MQLVITTLVGQLEGTIELDRFAPGGSAGTAFQITFAHPGGEQQALPRYYAPTAVK
jgi:hypothetical protein